MAKKYMETCSMLAVIRERQIKAISLLPQWPQLRGGVAVGESVEWLPHNVVGVVACQAHFWRLEQLLTQQLHPRYLPKRHESCVPKKMHSRDFFSTLVETFFMNSASYNQCNINYSGTVSWCLVLFVLLVLLVLMFFFLSFMVLLEKVWERKSMKLGGWARRWGGSGRSREGKEYDQNVLPIKTI